MSRKSQNPIIKHLIGSGLSIPELRALSPLEENAQRLVDKAVVKVGLERLIVAADVLGKGLIYPVPDPLSVMEIQWEQISKTGGAQRTMAPDARGENQLPDRKILQLPVYLTTDDFSINIRTLKMSERIGTPLDTTLVEDATRRVNESIEDALINGAGDVQVTKGPPHTGSMTVPGLINAPNVNKFKFGSSLTSGTTVITRLEPPDTIKSATNGAGTSWADSSINGGSILADVINGITVLQTNRKFGPYHLYVGTTIGNKLQNDYATTGVTVTPGKTIMQRLEEVDAGNGAKLVVKVADRIPADTAILVQMTNDTVEMIDGQAPTVIPWTSASGFVMFWLVLAIMIPRVRDDYDQNSGVLVFSLTGA
jgi:hypothetical protein